MIYCSHTEYSYCMRTVTFSQASQGTESSVRFAISQRECLLPSPLDRSGLVQCVIGSTMLRRATAAKRGCPACWFCGESCSEGSICRTRIAVLPELAAYDGLQQRFY